MPTLNNFFNFLNPISKKASSESIPNPATTSKSNSNSNRNSVSAIDQICCTSSFSSTSSSSPTSSSSNTLRKPSKSASLNVAAARGSDVRKLGAVSLNSLSASPPSTNPQKMSPRFFFFSNLQHRQSHNHQPHPKTHSSIPIIPDPIRAEAALLVCMQTLQNPFDLCLLASLNTTLSRSFHAKLEHIEEMEVRKVKLTDTASESFGEKSGWFQHPGAGGNKIRIRFAKNEAAAAPRRVEIRVDECWSSSDVLRLCRMMEMFRRSLKRICVDSPIMELVN